MHRISELFKRFRRDENGAFMVLFAVLAIVLIATSGAVVDFTYTQTARSRAQDALDAAALAMQAKIQDINNGDISEDDAKAEIKTQATEIMQERLADDAITAQVNNVDIDTGAGRLNLQAQITVPTAFVQLVGVRNITATLTSEAVRGSTDIEVSVALDTTGSMGGQKIADLISATNTLIDMVVQDNQSPTYSKMAIVPWSAAVNVGTYADSVRGTPTPGTGITNATWMSTSTASITSITNANPAVLTTSSAHGLHNGDYVWLSGVGGMTRYSSPQLPDGRYKVNHVTSTTAQLQWSNGSNVDSRSWSAYSTWPSRAKITGCLNSSCQVVVTSAGHGLATNDYVYITGVRGMTQINNSAHPVGAVTASTFVITDEDADSVGYSSYTSGGTAYCTKYGCLYYYFPSSYGGHTLWKANSCATERPGTHAFDDAAPSTALLDFNYTNNGTDCIGQTIQPLTSDKDTLHALANSLTATGSTAGHLGLAWGWYMIAPNFASLWPTASQPAAYGKANLIKAVVLMTDGQFNLQYCNGVTSRDTGSGTRINCDAPNGDSRTQAEALCNAIKADDKHTLLYTVGFDLGNDTDSLDFLRDCATSPNYFFQADTGADLTDAFKAIAQNLNKLRLSK